MIAPVGHGVGIDIGGAFAAITLAGEDGTIATRRVSSTLRDRHAAIVGGSGALLAEPAGPAGPRAAASATPRRPGRTGR